MTTRTAATCVALAVFAGVAASAQAPPTPTAGVRLAPGRDRGVAPPGRGPDVTSGSGLVVGGEVGGQGGKFVAWGGTVVLTRRDAIAPRKGACAFNVAYDEVNAEPFPTERPFVNVLRREGNEISRQTNRHLGPGEVKRVFTQVLLASGPAPQRLSLTLDDGRDVVETDESNNRFELFYVLKEDCTPPTPTR